MVQGMKRDKVLGICGVSKHQFYYRPTGGKRGRKPSGKTLQLIGNEHIERTNEDVINHMKQVLKDPKIDYGYHRMTGELTLSGFYINPKKVYRLMKESRLLHPPAKRPSRQYVQYRIICPQGPLRVLEMDIKMVWIEGLRRYAFILTILDVFTRTALHWRAGFQMRQEHVQDAWREVMEEQLEPMEAYAWEMHIEIRSDNGPQFCAGNLRKFLADNFFVQTFTHPYTPQENGHIESFHAILSRALDGQYFGNEKELRSFLADFYSFYNYRRIHGSIAKLPPMTFWNQWLLGNIDRKIVDEKRRRVRFSLKIPRQEVPLVQFSGNANLREVSRYNPVTDCTAQVNGAVSL